MPADYHIDTEVEEIKPVRNPGKVQILRSSPMNAGNHMNGSPMNNHINAG